MCSGFPLLLSLVIGAAATQTQQPAPSVSQIVGEALISYPHQPTAAIAQAPRDEFSSVWDTFYREDISQRIPWNKLYLAADPSDFDGIAPDRNLVFAHYTISAYRHDEMVSLAKSLGAGKFLRDLLEEGRLKAVGRDPISGKISGEGNLLFRTAYTTYDAPFHCTLPIEYWLWEARPAPLFMENRLVLSDELKEQLRATDLDLKNTLALSVSINGYASGILFNDQVHEYFFIQSLDEPRIPDGPPLEYTPGCAEDYTPISPVEATALKAGTLVSLGDLAADFQRIAYGDWYYTLSSNKAPANTGKPVIYLYPEKETDVSVKLRFQGDLTYTYPAYGHGWNVIAHPDGRMVNKADGSEHYYLFWEGVSDGDWTFDQGFCVKGTDTEAFLREKLPLLGLTPREYNDFITYWVPKMQGNPYNLIKFADTEYDKLASLTVTPKPDTLARIHMVYKPLEKPVEIPPQSLSGFERKGFTVVEWGGTEAGPKSAAK